jgi:hypothetical protein
LFEEPEAIKLEILEVAKIIELLGGGKERRPRG